MAWGYILWWLLRFIGAVKVAPVIPVLFILLSVFEVTVACAEASLPLHRILEKSLPPWLDGAVKWGADRLIIRSPIGLFVFFLISVLAAIVLAWHHRRMTSKIEGYQRFLGSLRGLMEESLNLSLSSADSFTTMHFIEQRGLQTLAVWSTRRNTEKFAAALLFTEDGGQRYKLECQWPPGTYVFPDKGNEGPCAAQKSMQTRRLIYVPRTQFRHGVELEWNDSAKAFTGFDLAEDAFVPWLRTWIRFVPKATICFLIPAESATGKKYVLCLDSNEGNAFKLVDFEAVHVIGNVIGRIITDLQRRMTRE